MEQKLTIKFYFTDCCNFNCEYCTRELLAIKNPKVVSCEEIDKFISNIKHLKISTFKLFGAEPSTYENFFYLLDKVKTLDCENILIFTNGTNIEFYHSLLPYINDKILLITSLHLKYKDSFINNLDFIKNNFNVKFNILLDKRYEYYVDEVFNKIKDSSYSLTPIYIGDERSIFELNNKFCDMRFVTKFCKKYSYNTKDILNLDKDNKKLYDCVLKSITILPSGKFYYSGCFKYYFKDYLNSTDYNFFGDEPYKHTFHRVKCDGSEYRISLIYSCKEMSEYYIDNM